MKAASTQIKSKSERTTMFTEKQEDRTVPSLRSQQGYENTSRSPLLGRIPGFTRSEISTNKDSITFTNSEQWKVDLSLVSLNWEHFLFRNSIPIKACYPISDIGDRCGLVSGLSWLSFDDRNVTESRISVQMQKENVKAQNMTMLKHSIFFH